MRAEYIQILWNPMLEYVNARMKARYRNGTKDCKPTAKDVKCAVETIFDDEGIWDAIEEIISMEIQGR